MISNELRISVRSLIENTMRKGDLCSGFVGGNRSVQGIKAHQKVQKLYELILPEGIEFVAEQQIEYKLHYDGFDIVIEGRIDGIFSTNNRITIDEIKSTYSRFEEIPGDGYEPHWAQALCYGYIYASLSSLDEINVQLTYYQLETEEIKSFIREYELYQLKSYFFELLDKYLIWSNLSRDWELRRNQSIRKCQFPYEAYRKGQRKFAVAVYKTIEEGKKIFIQAPTGTGKTVSVLFPSIKAMGEGFAEKIFYLTARTTQRQIAEDTIVKMNSSGLVFKCLTITAKEKICFKEKMICDPEYCEYAKGYYDKVEAAVLDILDKEHIIKREVIEIYAEQYKLCPFEFTLDISLWVDCVICDYNYVFDPGVYLKRYFSQGGGDFIFLVDESHNLVERARDMYSAAISKREILDLKKTLKNGHKKSLLQKNLTKINAFLLEEGKRCGDKLHKVETQSPKEIYPLLRSFLEEAEQWFICNHGSIEYEAVLDMYFKLDIFLRIAELYDEKYVAYVQKSSGDTILKLFCVDPSTLLNGVLKRGKSSVFFSATLSPIEYFREILGGDEEDYIMRLDSPFDISKLGLFVVDNISTKYRNREHTYDLIAESIHTAFSRKKGNYIAFFPSYKYMSEVYQRFVESYPNIQTIAQRPAMSEGEKLEFLEAFKDAPTYTNVAFAVLGGIFSEGIDLVGDRLIGVAIVGVGLPQLCLERDIIMDYFNNTKGCGYEYAYIYPGMNKVMQAGGRVIRSEADKGIILLIDERYLQFSYKRLFPKEWHHCAYINNPIDMSSNINMFWSRPD